MNFFADLIFVGLSSFLSALFSAPITFITDFLVALSTALIA